MLIRRPLRQHPEGERVRRATDRRGHNPPLRIEPPPRPSGQSKDSRDATPASTYQLLRAEDQSTAPELFLTNS